jgi:hypothetical protein
MPLYAYNLTTLPIEDEIPSVTLPAFPQTNGRGPACNVTGQLRKKSRAFYAQLQVKVAEGKIIYVWTVKPEYETPGLSTESSDTKQSPPIAQPPPPEYPVIVRVVQLGEPPEGEQGTERSIEIQPPVEFPLRILLVTGAITRGAPGAQVYLCCHPQGGHDPHSDKFDASQPGILQETSHVGERVVEEGEEFYLYCSSDYVRGYLTVLMQRAA